MYMSEVFRHTEVGESVYWGLWGYEEIYESILLFPILVA
jgi:hypothetical protein